MSRAQAMTAAPGGGTDTRLGIRLMMATTFVFAMQDGISRHLAGEYNVMMVVMIRYWFFAAFVIVVAARRAGRPARRRGHVAAGACRCCAACCWRPRSAPWWLGFVLLGLVESHAVFTCYPLLIAALSGPVLGERVGWRRWAAIGVGFAGVLVILQPGFRVFSPAALVPLAAALMFALYGLLTRYVARADSAATSLLLDRDGRRGGADAGRALVLGADAAGRLGAGWGCSA